MDIPVRRAAAFDPWVEFDTFQRPARLIDQYFGAGLEDDEIFVPTSRLYTSSRYPIRQRLFRPTSYTAGERDGGVAELKVGKDKFSVKLDVHQFTPDEITVKTKDNNLIVEAKHEEKEDPHGFVSRQFSRRYVLPEDIRVENLLCNMSSDGVLAIEAPRAPPKLEGENVIPINQTGRPAVPAGTGVTTKNIEIERHSSPQSTAEANAPASSNQTS